MNAIHWKITRSILLTFLLVSLAAAVIGADRSAAGHLVIIGGGERSPALMREIVRLGGGTDARFVVIPAASSEPEEVGEYQAGQLREAGAGAVSVLHVTADTAGDPPTRAQAVATLDAATGVFFSGGDQRRLADLLEDSPLLERIHALHRRGGVVAGTSAGAAVMSPVMITGDETGVPEDADSADRFTSIRAGRVITRAGFDFLPGTVVDQHFVARKRHNRLIAVVLERPELLGIGIDESTAVVVEGDDRFQVVGEGAVVVYDASDATAIEAGPEGGLSATGVRMHLLRAGQRFDLRRRAVGIDP